jgi:hypothetical protein
MNAGRLLRHCERTGWLLVVLLATTGAAPVWSQARFAVSVDGTEVADALTSLVWQRCSVGQSYNGATCVGSASTFTHEQALLYAKGQPGWRLPNVKELASIVDTERANPSIDIAIFPATADWYWTSSPYVGNAGFAWAVSFDFGDVNRGGFRYHSFYVRLVR